MYYVEMIDLLIVTYNVDYGLSTFRNLIDTRKGHSVVEF